jgi:hypothetical protein
VQDERTDDILVAVALALCAVLCAAFRYLPMVDLPQHYAMVSILLHRADPDWGFAQRYTTDFAHRPYATVYWLGEALGLVMPLGAAMRVVIGLCTVAPFAGAHALLAATRRPRVWLLPAIPFAFGSLWHWGFLNFLLGTGLFLAGLALVVVVSDRPSRRAVVALGAVGVALLLTHFHGLLMLLLFAPLFAWAWRGEGRGRASYVRALGPLAPSAVGAAAFVLVTWARAEGSWPILNPGLPERIARFPEFLATGLPEPWPGVELVTLVVPAVAGVVAGGAFAARGRPRIALAVALGAQTAMYLWLPLNTRTATYVSARHALLVVLFALPLLPALAGRRLKAARVACALGAALGLGAVGWHLVCFEREASDFDGVLRAMAPARRVASLVYERGCACTHPATFPFLHFAAYYQATRGGDVSKSLATVWNIPIRYRDDYRRYAVRDDVEWAPWLFTREDATHFDYVLVRGGPSQPPSLTGLAESARSGAWRLYENRDAVPAELPSP